MKIEDLIPPEMLRAESTEYREMIGEGRDTSSPDRRLEFEWLKQLVGFANSYGGSLLVGVDPVTHELCPIEHASVNRLVLTIQRLIREHVEPEMTYRVIPIMIPGSLPSKYVLRIDIAKSKNPPIALRFREYSSVFVRHMGIAEPARGEEIRDLVMNSESVSFDQTFIDRDFDPKDFSLLYEEFRKANHRELTEKELTSIGFISVDEKLSRGAELFLDSYSSPRTLAVCTQYLGFEKSDRVFSYTERFSGNLIEEFKQIRSFVISRSHNGFRKGSEDQRELVSYPVGALNEGIINAIVHRNYFIGGSQIEINLFKDRLQIVSPGSLIGSKYLSKEKNLPSIPPIRRNEVICEVFRMLRLTEKSGSGLGRIYQEYSRYGKEYSPYVSSTNTYFELDLPDLSFAGGPVDQSSDPEVSVLNESLDSRDLEILSLCYNRARTIAEIADHLKVQPSTYFRKAVIDRLCKKGYLIRSKRPRNSTYRANHDLVFPQTEVG